MAESQPNETVKNTVDLDSISLEQALRDFEIANARVIDLTKRLTALNKQVLKTTSSLQRARLRNRALQAELDALKASTSYRSVAAAARVYRGARARLGR
jgi:predicted  nucleic acid-binding Zn-ribbon protein